MDIEAVELSIVDNDLPASEAAAMHEPEQEPAKEPEKQPEPQPAPVPQVDIRAAVQDALAEIAQHMPVAPAGQTQLSPVQQQVALLRQQGIPQEAIDNMLNLFAAAQAEQDAHRAAYTAQMTDKQYNQYVIDLALEALTEVSAPIKQLKNAGEGQRMDFVKAMSDLVHKDPHFKDLARAIDSRKQANKMLMKEAASKVCDAWCAENDITKPSTGINLKSSRPDATDAKDFNPDNLSREARQIYDINLKATGDKAKARQRALATR